MFASVHVAFDDEKAFAPLDDPRWVAKGNAQIAQQRRDAAARRRAELDAQRAEVKRSQSDNDEHRACDALAKSIDRDQVAEAAGVLLRTSLPSRTHTYYIVTHVHNDQLLRRLLIDYFTVYCADRVAGAHRFLAERFMRVSDAKLSIEYGWLFVSLDAAQQFYRGDAHHHLVRTVTYRNWSGVRSNAAAMPTPIVHPLQGCDTLPDDAIVAFIWHKRSSDRPWQTPMEWVDVEGARTQSRLGMAFDDKLARSSVRAAFTVRRVTCTGVSLCVESINTD